MSWSVAALVAPLMAGYVIDRFGAEWLWGSCAALGTVAAAGYWLLMRALPETGTANETKAVVDAAPARADA
jgi:hypothetical protein